MRVREEGRHVRGNSSLVSKREPVIDPALEKPFLKLHRAVDVKSFWKAVHRVLSASVLNHSIGLSLQQSPGVPVVSRWTRHMPNDFFVAKPLRSHGMHPRRKQLTRLADLFSNRSSFERSPFYRR